MKRSRIAAALLCPVFAGALGAQSPRIPELTFARLRPDRNYILEYVRADGTKPQTLSERGVYRVFDLAWSPDGERLAFTCRRQVHVLDAATDHTVNLGTGEVPTDVFRSSLSWAQGGKKIVFVSGDEPNGDICVLDVKSGKTRRLTGREAHDHSPAADPTGRKIAWLAGRPTRQRSGEHGFGPEDLWVMMANGAGKRNLTRHPGKESMFAWSPDGRSIAFCRQEVRSVENGRTILGNEDIYVIAASGAGLTNLTNDDSVDRWPAWSPDGRSIAFCSDRPNSGWLAIYSMDSDGRNVRLLKRVQGQLSRPAWSPDGKKIACLQTGGRRNALYVMDADGENFHLVSEGAPEFAWR